MRWADIERMRDAPTYRQMDTWTTQGLIRVETSSNPGIGKAREWSATQVSEAFRIKRLSDLGLRLDIIRTVLAARKNEVGERSVELSAGIRLTIG